MSKIHELIISAGDNKRLGIINNCPGVPIRVSEFIYGKIQNDFGNGTVIQNDSKLERQIADAIGFSGTTGETAVWHFIATSASSAIHHFVVVSSYEQSSKQGRKYIVLMAYEKCYTLADYVNGKGNAPKGKDGFNASRSANEFSDMLRNLLTSSDAWGRYFGGEGGSIVNKITYWKYNPIAQ